MAYDLKIADEFLDFEEFCKRFSPRVKDLVVQYTGDPALAEDVTQETLLRAYRFQHTFDPSRPMWPWLSRIAVRACSNALRDTRVAIEEPSGALASKITAPTPLTGPAPLPGADPAEQILAREGALETLHPRHQRVLVLRYLFGWNHREIAEHEGISLAGVASLIRRARDSFRKAVNDGKHHTEAALVLPLKDLLARARSLLGRAQSKTTAGAEIYLPLDTALGAGVAAMLAAGVAALTTLGALTSQSPSPNLAVLTAHHAPVAIVPSGEIIRPVGTDTAAARIDKPEPHGTNGTVRSIAVTIDSPGGAAPAGPGGAAVESGKGQQRSLRGKTWAQLVPKSMGDETTLEEQTTFYCDGGMTAKTFCTVLDVAP